MDDISASFKVVLYPFLCGRDTGISCGNSYAEFNLDIKAEEMFKPGDKYYWDGEWLPGSLNLHGKLDVTDISVDDRLVICLHNVTYYIALLIVL